jgi:putative endonuclease
MYYTYIIETLNGKHRFIGHCRNLKSQLNQHNSRNVKATRDNRPWRVIYSEKFKIKNDAISREKYFKSISGKNGSK